MQIGLMRLWEIIVALLITASWGFGYVAIKVCLTSLNPVTLTFFRFLFSSVPFLYFFRPPQVSLKILIPYSLIGFAIQFVLLFWGIYLGIEAGVASLLLQTQVFFSIFLGALFLKEEIHLRNWIGSGVAFLGLAIIAYQLHAQLQLIGLFPILAAAACSGISNLFAKKMSQSHSISIVVWGSLIATFPLLLAALYVEGPASFWDTILHLTPLTISGILYISIFATIFSYGGWNWLLRHAPMHAVTPFGILIPVFALFFGMIFLHESIDFWKFFATTLVLTGLLINLFGHHLLRARSF